MYCIVLYHVWNLPRSLIGSSFVPDRCLACHVPKKYFHIYQDRMTRVQKKQDRRGYQQQIVFSKGRSFVKGEVFTRNIVGDYFVVNTNYIVTNIMHRMVSEYIFNTFNIFTDIITMKYTLSRNLNFFITTMTIDYIIRRVLLLSVTMSLVLDLHNNNKYRFYFLPLKQKVKQNKQKNLIKCRVCKQFSWVSLKR